jgi:hypothetical protein
MAFGSGIPEAKDPKDPLGPRKTRFSVGQDAAQGLPSATRTYAERPPAAGKFPVELGEYANGPLPSRGPV